MARGWIRGESGAAAVEFALIVPGFVALTVGTMYMGMVMFAYANLQSVVQEAARCASVRPTLCADQASIATFATARYRGPGVSPSYAYAVADCGHRVTATASLTLVSGLPAAGGAAQPITVTACHP